MSAIIYREYTLLCDGPDDCKAAFGPFGVERTLTRLRRLAAQEGWTSVKNQDFCPKHKPED